MMLMPRIMFQVKYQGETRKKEMGPVFEVPVKAKETEAFRMRP